MFDKPVRPALLALLVSALLVVAGEASELGASGLGASSVRDPALWPFSADSPWNMPLGSEAQLAAITSPAFTRRGGANLNVARWSHPVYLARVGDPVVVVAGDNFGAPVSYRIRVPVIAVPDMTSDGALHIVDETHQFVVEMWRARRVRANEIAATVAIRNDLMGAGVYDAWHGARAYGGSALGGLIRRHELEGNHIPHALAVATHGGSLNRHGPSGRSWVWPASASDGGRFYGVAGNLFMGSLLAIPPDTDLARLGLGQQALAVARALQDYGAYIVDKGSGNVIFYVEPGAVGVVAMTAQELSKLVPFLKVVRNNGPANVGGGGVPRRPPAPSFSVDVGSENLRTGS